MIVLYTEYRTMLYTPIKLIMRLNDVNVHDEIEPILKVASDWHTSV